MIFPDMKGLPLHRVMVRTVTEFIDDEMSTYASALAAVTDPAALQEAFRKHFEAGEMQAAVRVQERILAPLDVAERQQLMGLLAKLVSNHDRESAS